MRRKKRELSAIDDLFRICLEQMLDQRHALYRAFGKTNLSMQKNH